VRTIRITFIASARAEIPEPASLALVGLGLPSLIGTRRAKKAGGRAPG
jgi:hypothetical protein